MAENRIEEFTEKWERIAKLSQLVQSLDKAEDYEDSFRGYYRNFLEFLETEHNLYPDVMKLIPIDDVRAQLGFSKEYFEKYRMNSLKYGRDNLEGILDDLEKNKLGALARTVVPIKDTDLGKSDDLDALIKSYEDSRDNLKRYLEQISLDTDKERFEMQSETLQEYEELISLFKDYRQLIENSIKYSRLISNMRGEDGKPKVDAMSALFSDYLNGLLDRFKDDKDKYEDNLPVVETIRALSGRDPNFLTRAYYEYMIKPATVEFDSIAGGSDLKDYVKRNVKVMTTTRQMQFFDNLYNVAVQSEEE